MTISVANEDFDEPNLPLERQEIHFVWENGLKWGMMSEDSRSIFICMFFLFSDNLGEILEQILVKLKGNAKE